MIDRGKRKLFIGESLECGVGASMGPAWRLSEWCLQQVKSSTVEMFDQLGSPLSLEVDTI